MALLLFVLFIVSYLFHGPLLQTLAALLITHEQPIPSDALVLLSGGEPGRAWGAADLYRERLAEFVVVTLEYPPPDVERLRLAGIDLVSPMENNIRILCGLGVPQDRILRVAHVQNTLDELIRIREVAQARRWRSLIIVTSNYHTRRTEMTAQSVFAGSGLRFYVVGSRHPDFHPDDWWTSRGEARIFFFEFEKLLAYKAYLFSQKFWTW